MHSRRLTLQKLRARIAFIKSTVVYRQELALPSFKFKPGVNPLIGTGIDDADWAKIEPGTYWGAYRQEYTLRTIFTVPKEWQSPVALYLPLGTSQSLEALSFLYGPEALAYIDGQPYQGVDPNHREILLPDEYFDGLEHKIALHGWTGIKDERYEMATPRIVQIDTLARKFVQTTELALQTVEELAPSNPTRTQLLNVLDEAVLALDLLEPIGDRFYESLPAAYQILQDGLASAGPPMGVKVSGVGHAHIDVAWLWTTHQTRNKAARTFSTVLRLMEQYPDFHFSQSQPQLYRYVEEDHPQMMEEIKQRVAEGRWEILGGMWIEADCNITGAESLARQFVLGRQYFLDKFGKRDAPILWLPDVFGYAWQLPQLIKQAGLSYFVTAKLSWNQYNRIPYDIFQWQGLDGTQVFTYFITTSKPGWWGATYSADLSPAEMMTTWDGFQNKAQHNEFMIAFGHGDGGGGPTSEMLENSQRMANFPGLPSVQLERAETFLDRIEKQSPGNLPVWNGELYLELHRGTYTSQARNKRLNRKCEFLLHDAEFLAAWATRTGGYRYPHQTLKQAWELLCLNQFHDIIPGSSIHEVYTDSLKDYDEIVKLVGQVRGEALEALDRTMPNEAAVVIYNPTAFVRSEVVEIDSAPGNAVFQIGDGDALPMQLTGNGCLVDIPDIPPYGYVTLKPNPDLSLPVTEGAFAAENLLENSFIRAEFDTNGDLIRLFDKRAEREILAPGQKANVWQAFEDRPLDWEAWDIDIFYDEKKWEAEPATEIEILEQGPLRASLQITRRILDSEIVQRVVLSHRSAKLDFHTWVNWRQRRVLLKVAFPVAIHSPRATYEIPWGNVERPTHQNTSWDWARFESCAHKWVDLSEGDYGVSLLNDCKYGHDIKDNVMRLTVLKGATFPDPEADLGEHNFVYSIFPHQDDWRNGTVSEAYCLNDPLVVHHIQNGGSRVDLPFVDSLVQTADPQIIIETIKEAEDGNGLIVRLYEHHRKRGKVTLDTGFDIREAYITDLLERNEQPVDVTGKRQVQFYLKPYQIVTCRLIPTGGD